MTIFSTRRLTVRRFRAMDGRDLFEYLSDPVVVKYEPYPPYSAAQAEAEAMRRGADGDFYAVCLPKGKVIGNLYLHQGDFNTWELGYVFNRHYWGHGYAAESAAALHDYAFCKLGARRITAMCNPENTPSWRLLERIGMRREGKLLKNVFFFRDDQGEPIWQDTFLYGILKEEANGLKTQEQAPS